MSAAEDAVATLHRQELANALTHGLGAGTPFYHNERLRYAHAVWHLFVLAGSVCHILAVATLL